MDGRNTMMAPAWFKRELNAFDPDLRVRWSRRLELFQLERRVKNALHPGTVRNDAYHDDQIRAADGYILVASIPPRGFGRHIFDRLRASDLWSNGGWERIADELDAMDERAEELRQKALEGENEAIAREIYDLWAHRSGRSVYSTGFPGVS